MLTVHVKNKTNAAWRARYARREESVAERVAELRTRGHNAVAVAITPQGPGIPGGITYMGGIEIDGKPVSRREVRALLES